MLKIDTWVRKNSTIGIISCDGFNAFSLELPWRDNKQTISCIPDGTYHAAKYNSPKHGKVILLEDVPKRSFIEIHAGNYTHQILGCILIGDGIKFLDDDDIPDVTNSRATLAKLLNILPERFKVLIKRNFNA